MDKTMCRMFEQDFSAAASYFLSIKRIFCHSSSPVYFSSAVEVFHH